ncbi:MAG: hypothetical protein AB7O48_00150 [Cyclobacteriaceae bacterium]
MKFVFTLITAAVAIAVVFGYSIAPLPSFFYQSLALLLVGTGGIYFYLVDIKREKPDYFVQIYIATLFAKILAYGAYMFFVLWEDKGGAANNALFFMVTYFIFTAIEIIFLYRKVNG